MAESSLQLITAGFGLLLTAIGALCFARLVHVSGEIKDLWQTINKIKEQCQIHTGELGYLKGKVDKK